MANRTLLGLITMATLVTFGAFGSACFGGGGNKDPLTISEYVQSVLSVDQQHETRAAP